MVDGIASIKIKIPNKQCPLRCIIGIKQELVCPLYVRGLAGAGRRPASHENCELREFRSRWNVENRMKADPLLWRETAKFYRYRATLLLVGLPWNRRTFSIDASSFTITKKKGKLWNLCNNVWVTQLQDRRIITGSNLHRVSSQRFQSVRSGIPFQRDRRLIN